MVCCRAQNEMFMNLLKKSLAIRQVAAGFPRILRIGADDMNVFRSRSSSPRVFASMRIVARLRSRRSTDKPGLWARLTSKDETGRDYPSS